MAVQAAVVMARAVRSAKAELKTLSDQDLLERFAERGDQTAFAVVVERHSTMVLGVCKRVLHSQADAEDACQAVFLILAKKVNANRWQASVANWLYSTARKVAANARTATVRRTKREGAAAVPETQVPVDTVTGRELIAALDEELDRLPPRYREALVLCYLEGLTRDEAAARLGVPEATLKSQLERGRKKLAAALTVRGYALGVILLATAATSSAGAFPPRLLDSILASTGGSPSSFVAALAQGVIVNGTLTKAKQAALAAVAFAILALGFTTLQVGAEPQKPMEKMEKPAAKKDEPKKPQEKTRTITGKVLDSDGKPVQAEIALVWYEGKPQPLGRANADGTFKVTVPLTRGEYGGWLVAKAAGHGVDFLEHGADYLPASMTATAEVTLKLPKERPLKGRVIDQQGKPVAGATVVASNLAAFDGDASRDGHFKAWATETYQRGTPPSGDRTMYFASGHRIPSDNIRASPYSAKTDADGRFEINGLGVNHLVSFLVHGRGVADKYLIALNRDGFDPAPINKAAKDNEPKGYSFGGKWLLYGPEPTVVMEPEKIVRGRVTDAEGKPRAGVNVVFSRTSKRNLNADYNQAKTDHDGKYEIRGARKHDGYGVEVDADPKAGLLECQGFADDTVGYEPITIDLKQAKGVVVTGRVTNKATGQPVQAQLFAEVLRNNAFVDKYPPFLHKASMSNENNRTDKDGRYRIVTIPGPVIIMAGPVKGSNGEYKPHVLDPKHAEYFSDQYGGQMVLITGNAFTPLQGCWCKVIESKATETEVSIDIEFEPASKTIVKVVDAGGKPLKGCKATGLSLTDFDYPTEFLGDELTVFNLEIPVPERKRSELDLMMKKPKEKAGRLLAVIHEKRKLVGALTFTTADKEPVVVLAEPGTLTGRVVGKDGKPLAGLTVYVSHVRREVTEAFRAFNGSDQVTTDANGEYRLEGLFPGQEFTLGFFRGQQRFGPEHLTAIKFKATWPGEKRKLNELELEPSKDGE